MSILDRPTVLLKSLLLLMVIMDMSILDRPTVLLKSLLLLMVIMDMSIWIDLQFY